MGITNFTCVEPRCGYFASGSNEYCYCPRCGIVVVLRCENRNCPDPSHGITVLGEASCAKCGNLYRYDNAWLPHRIIVPESRSATLTGESDGDSMLSASISDDSNLFDLRAASGDPDFRHALSAYPDIPIRNNNIAPNGKEQLCFGQISELRAVCLRHDRLYALPVAGRIGSVRRNPDASDTDAAPLELPDFWRWPDADIDPQIREGVDGYLPDAQPGGFKTEETLNRLVVTDALLLVGHRGILFGWDAANGGNEGGATDMPPPLFRISVTTDWTEWQFACCGDALLLVGIDSAHRRVARLYRLSELVEERGNAIPHWEESLSKDTAKRKEVPIHDTVIARPSVFYLLIPETGDLWALRHDLHLPPKPSPAITADVPMVTNAEGMKKPKLITVLRNLSGRDVHSITLGNRVGALIYYPPQNATDFDLATFALVPEATETSVSSTHPYTPSPKTHRLEVHPPHENLRWIGLCGADDDIVLVGKDHRLYRFPIDNPNHPRRTWEFLHGDDLVGLVPPILFPIAGKWHLVGGGRKNQGYEPYTLRAIALDAVSTDVLAQRGVKMKSNFSRDNRIILAFMGSDVYTVDLTTGTVSVQTLGV